MEPSTPLRSLLTFALLLAVNCISGSAQGTVTGSLKIGEQRYGLKHITAVRVPNTFDANKKATRLSLSDLPVTEEALRDPMGVARLKGKGGFHGVVLEIGDERSYISMNIWSSDHDIIVSMSGTMDEVTLASQTSTQITGKIEDLEKTFSDTTFKLSSEFSAPLQEQPEAPKGATKTGSAVSELESVRVYLAMRKAVRAADMKTIQKLARYPQDFEGADGQKFVKLMQSEEPLNIEVVEASESGDTASLTVTGTLEGKAIRRSFQMQKKEGKWSTNNDNWEAN